MSRGDENDIERGRVSYNGERGGAFRKYKRDFLSLARGRFAKDDRYSFMTAFLRTDEGGTGQGAPAMGSKPCHSTEVIKGNTWTFDIISKGMKGGNITIRSTYVRS